MIDVKVTQNYLKMLLSLRPKLTNFSRIIVNYRKVKDLNKKIMGNLTFAVKASPKIVLCMTRHNWISIQP